MDQDILDSLVKGGLEESHYQGCVVYVMDLSGPDPDIIPDEGLNEATRLLLEREGYYPVPAYEVLANNTSPRWGHLKEAVRITEGFVVPASDKFVYLIAGEWEQKP